jgi:hypothetical protein
MNMSSIRLNGSASWLHAAPAVLRLRIPLAPEEGTSAPPAGADGAPGAGVPSPASGDAAAQAVADRLFGTPQEQAAAGGAGGEQDKPADKAAEGDAGKDKPAEGEAEKKEGEAEGEKKDDPASFSVEKITLPEGVEIDKAALDAAAPVIKELGLGQEQGQKLVDAYVEIRKQEAANYAATVAGWIDTAKKDPELGGPKWDGTVHAARTAVEKFGTPELKEYLEMTGAGNHPEVIRAFARAGAAISEDQPVVAAPAGSQKAGEDVATLLYGKG